MSTSVQRAESGYTEGGTSGKQEVQQRERRKQWSWKGIAFAISLRSTKVTRTIRKRPSPERIEPYQPVRVMAMAQPAAAPTPPDDGSTEQVTTTNNSLIIQMGPLDLMPPNTSDGPH